MTATLGLSKALELLQLTSAENLTTDHVQEIVDKSDLVRTNPLAEADYWEAFHVIRGFTNKLLAEENEKRRIESNRTKQYSHINLPIRKDLPAANSANKSHRSYLNSVLNNITKLDEAIHTHMELERQKNALVNQGASWQDGIGEIEAKFLSSQSNITSLKGSVDIYKDVTYLYSLITCKNQEREIRFFLGPFSRSVASPGFVYISLNQSLGNNLFDARLGDSFVYNSQEFVIEKLDLADKAWLRFIMNSDFWENDFLSSIGDVLPDGSKINQNNRLVTESWNGVVIVGSESVQSPNLSNNSRYRKGG
jgi:hypothetical protein